MKIISIRYLRAVAALLVVLTHASSSLLRDRSVIPLEFGQYGVDLFFVISGFIMYFTTARSSVTALDFWIKRGLRIWPLYFMLTTIALAMGIFLKGKVNSFSGSPTEYIMSLLFIPYLNSMTGDIKPLIGQGWTLDYEVFFYAIFGLTLFAGRAFRLAICCCVLLGFATAGLFLRNPGPILETYTNPIILEFIWGMIVAYAVSIERRCIPILLWTVLPVAFALTAVSAVYGIGNTMEIFAPGRSIVIGIPCMALVLVAVLVEERGRVPRWSFPLLVGEASYSLYLAHGFVLGLIRQVWTRLLDPQNAMAHITFIVFGTTCCVVALAIIYLCLERKSANFLLSLSRRLPLFAAMQSTQK